MVNVQKKQQQHNNTLELFVISLNATTMIASIPWYLDEKKLWSWKLYLESGLHDVTISKCLKECRYKKHNFLLVNVSTTAAVPGERASHLLGFISRCFSLSLHVHEQRSSQWTANILPSPHLSHHQEKRHVKQQPRDEDHDPHLWRTHSEQLTDWGNERETRPETYIISPLFDRLTNKQTWRCGAV